MTGRRTLVVMILGLVLFSLAIGLRAKAAVADSIYRVSHATDVITLEAIQDNTLYEENVLYSNGSGQHFFAGANADGNLRRGLVKFDIAGNVPSSALIVSATLQLHASKEPPVPSPEQFTIHRVLSDWGEGASIAPNAEGSGTPATEGDATWLDSFYSLTPTNRISWILPGGDFDQAASASTLVGIAITKPVPFNWGPSAAMIRDLNHWLHSPNENHGWLLKGDESGVMTARRFDSRENSEPEYRPVLYVEYLADPIRVHLPVVIRN